MLAIREMSIQKPQNIIYYIRMANIEWLKFNQVKKWKKKEKKNRNNKYW
jgi:hypothetical protein